MELSSSRGKKSVAYPLHMLGNTQECGRARECNGYKIVNLMSECECENEGVSE